MDKGSIHIYCGEGKGKTTAAIGQGIQEASQGRSVIIIQFMKERNAEAIGFVQRLEPEIKLFRFQKSDCLYDELSDEEKLEDLAASIQEHGLIQPVVLRSVGAGYEIVAGERRWRAARKAGVRNIPCIVWELSDEENMLLAIIENMQREDLNPIEEAEGINQMIETYGLTQDQVSKSVGKSRPYITNCLRLLKLPEDIQSFVSEGQLSAGHARAIVSAGNKEKQIALAEKAVKEGLSVRQIEKLAKDSKTGKAKAKPREKNADVKRVENDLKEALGTKVTLNQKGKKGKIEIEYYSKDDLERLIELLKTLH